VQRQFDLDDATLADVKAELLYAYPELGADAGHGLVWTGDAVVTPPPDPPLLAYTPPHLTDKILAARPALAGERKQVTVLFADLKDSTELIRRLDPEAAQQLLDPALQHMMAAVHRT
jgi:class 3 adenylate cyclase